MKKRGKQVVALAAALALSCSMMMGYAAGNTAEIVSVTAVRTLPGGGTENIEIDKGATPSAGTLTQVSEADLITVTIKLTAGADPVKAAEATFFSFLNDQFISPVCQQPVILEVHDIPVILSIFYRQTCRQIKVYRTNEIHQEFLQ